MKKSFDIPIISVGKLDDARLANALIENNEADLVAIGRGHLKNPHWSLNAAAELENQILRQDSMKQHLNLKFHAPEVKTRRWRKIECNT